jgi:O-antigen/teichoic acid export membrane protein
MVKGRKFGLLSSSLLYGLGGAAQRLVGFLLLPVFTRFLTPADYGIVGLLVALPALLLPVFSLGLSASISVCYFAADHPAARHTVIQTARWITYASAGLMTILSLTMLDWITHLLVGNLDYSYHALVSIVTVALNVLCLPLQLELQFSRRPLEFVIISLVGALFTSIGSLMLIVYFNLGAFGMLLGNLIGQVLALTLLLKSKKGRQASKTKADMGVAKELLKHGIPMLPSFVLLFILQNGVRWPLEWHHGMAAVGLYSLGSNFGATLTLFTSGFVAAWMPWAMAQGERWEEGRWEVATRLTQYLIGGGFLVLLFFFAAQPALRILTPYNYFDAWVVIGLAAASNFLTSLFSLILPPLYMAKKVSLVLISQGCAALVTLCMTYILMDFGILGAAIAVFLGTLTLVVIQVIVNTRLTEIKPIPFNKLNFIGISLTLGLTCAATFLLEVSKLENFIMLSLLLILFAGIAMFRCFPDKQLLLRKYLKGFP